MKQKFLRHTHNSDGSYRVELEKLINPFDEGVIQYLDQIPETFEEIVEFQADNFYSSEQGVNRGKLAEELVWLIENDLVKVVYE